MNLKELKKDIGTNFRLRPRPIRKTWRELLHARDDLWQLDDILDNPARLRLANVRTQRVIELQTDNVREYRTPDFLILRCQLIISRQAIQIEPLVGSGYEVLEKAISKTWRFLKLGFSLATVLFVNAAVLAIIHSQKSLTEVSDLDRNPTVKTMEEAPISPITRPIEKQRLKNPVVNWPAAEKAKADPATVDKAGAPAAPINVRQADTTLLKNSIDSAAYAMGQTLTAIALSKGLPSTTDFSLGLPPVKSDLTSTSTDSLSWKGGQGLATMPNPELLMTSSYIKDHMAPIGGVASDLISIPGLNTVTPLPPTLDHLSLRSSSGIASKEIGIRSLSELATSASDLVQPRIPSLSRIAEIPVLGRSAEDPGNSSINTLNLPISLDQLRTITRNCLPEKIDSLPCK